MKRGLMLILLIISLASTVMAVSEQEAVAALAKPSVVQIETSMIYTLEGERPYLENGEVLYEDTEEFSVFATKKGSGFIVTPNGYILSNAHVVIPEGVEEIAVNVLEQWGLDNTEVNRQHVVDNVRLVDATSNVFVKIPTHFLGKGVSSKMLPAEIKKVGESYPGLDLALLKVDEKNLPSLTLTSTEHLKPGHDVIIIGFPSAAGLVSKSFDATTTSGIISSEKSTDEFDLFQFDAAIETGSSGGPALDSSAGVVGVVTLSYDEKQGFNYFIPAEEASEFLRDALVTPKKGVVNSIYERALAHFWNGNYDSAVGDFRAVIDIYPAHPYAPEYLVESRILIEEDESDYSYIFLIIGGSLIALVIVLTIIIFWEKHRIEVLERR